MIQTPLLEVTGLSIDYVLPHQTKRAVQGVSFQVHEDEVFGLVGESGSGKSTLCFGLMNMIPPPGRITAGQVMFNGHDLLALSGEELRQVRWSELAYIPQGAMSSLNPVARIYDQFADTIKDHEGKQPRDQIRQRIREALEQVSLPFDVAGCFPHQLSGGMKQRVCIALGVILNPKLLLADEPTSALDVISQRVVLEMLSQVRQNLKASIILIGHDMSLQAQVADRLGILYGGKFMEIGSVTEIFNNPLHPYTQRLISSIPSIHKKQNISSLAQKGLSEAEKQVYLNSTELREVCSGHFVAV